MYILKKVRTRLEGIYQGDQTLEDPHRWHFPGKSYPTPKPPRNNTGDSTASTSSNNSGSHDGYVLVGRAKYLPTIIPDPAVMKNAFIPSDPTRVAVEEPDNGNSAAANRVSFVFPDSNHAAVHLALLECFRNLRRSADDLNLTGPATAAHTTGSPPAYSEQPRDEDIRGRPHGENSGSPSGSNPVRDGAADTDGHAGTGGVGNGTDRPSAASSTERWDLFLQVAVTRFTVWWLNIDKVLQHATAYTPQMLSGSSGMSLQLTKDYLPPLDVLLVWYAFMLHGSQEGGKGAEAEEFPVDHFDDAYKWACRNHVCKTFHPPDDESGDDHDARSLENIDAAIASARQQLENLAFPWVAIRDAIDFERMEYRPTRASLNLFTTVSHQEADIARYLAVPPAYVDHHGHPSPPPPHSDRDEGGIEPASTIFIDPKTGRPLDLVEAVKRLEQSSRSLINRAHSLLWVRGPSLGGSLDRACHAYFRWQIERYAAARANADIPPTLDEEKEELYSISIRTTSNTTDPTIPHRSIRRPRAPADLPFGVDLIWHTHRLFPAQYGHFCEELRRQCRKWAEDLATSQSVPEFISSSPSSSSDVCECWACERIRDERPDFAFFHHQRPRNQQIQSDADTDTNCEEGNDLFSSTSRLSRSSSHSSVKSSASASSSSSSSSSSASSAFSQDLVASPSFPPPPRRTGTGNSSSSDGSIDPNAAAALIIRSLAKSQVHAIRKDIGFHRAVEKARRRHLQGDNPLGPLTLPVRDLTKGRGKKGKEKKQHRRGTGSRSFRIGSGLV